MELKKVDLITLATCDGVRFRQVGDIKKFDQIGKSSSMRTAKRWIKQQLRAASEFSVCIINESGCKGVA